MSNNQVRGPSSALSSFLRERGIRAPPRNVWQRRNTGNADNNLGNANDNDANAPAPAVGNDVAGAPVNDNSTTGSRRRRTANLNANARGTEDVAHEATMMQIEVEVAPNESEQTPVAAAVGSSANRRQTKAKSAAGKGKASAKRKKGKKDSDDEDNDEAGGPSNSIAPRSNHSKRRKISDGVGMNGTIRFCDRCQRRYMVGDDEQKLCPACLSIQATKKTSAPARNKKKRGKIIPEGAEEGGPVKSLRNMCIKLIADYIDSVEEFGDISDATKTQIAKIISRYRQLNKTNVRLFIGPNEERVQLFECTYLDENALSHVAYMCPNVRQLYLGNCGRITDNVLKIISENCTKLESLHLNGSFLPSNDGFITLFEGLGSKLTELTLHHAAKLNKTGVEVLINKCPNLRELRLDHCLKLGDEGIRLLARLQKLEVLELSSLGEEVSEEGLLDVIRAVGANLRVLTLNGQAHLTDKVLNDAIAYICRNLQELSLNECEAITNEGMLEFLEKFTAASGLIAISLCRNVLLKDDVVVALINTHGATLQRLNLNGLDELTEYSLGAIAKGCPNMRELDVSWIRNVDDAILEALLANSRALTKVKVYGCNKLSEFIVNRRWLNEEQKEIRFIGNEYI